MKFLKESDPAYAVFRKTLNRRALPDSSVSEVVTGIIQNVTVNGNQALIELTEKFDKATLTPETLTVSPEERAEAREPLPPAPLA